MENPYCQYFIGFERFNDYEEPFDSSMLVHFRKRLNKEILMEVNEIIAKKAAADAMSKKDKDDNNDVNSNGTGANQSQNKFEANTSEENCNDDGKATSPKSDEESLEEAVLDNQGYLLLDATCAPSDIRYPTDLRLLNEAREKLEKIIDVLHQPDAGTKVKPRTYREKARKDYLAIEKQRKKRAKTVRKAIKKQLSYVNRDLGIIESYSSEPERFNVLSRKQKQELETIKVLYEQQFHMYKSKIHSIEDRIVSISQPHVRPIVRGKAGAEVEFGNKVMTSVVNGFCFIEKMSFDSFNEGIYLKEAVENYKTRFGFYPEAVLADTIFRNQINRGYLKTMGIRISGPSLGRPNKTRAIEKAKKQLEYIDSGLRNRIESTYGVSKRKFGLGLIKAKLKETAESGIVLQFWVMNLEQRLRLFLCQIFNTIYNFLLKLKILGNAELT